MVEASGYWTLGWAYLALMALTFIVNTACVARWNPVLIRRRVGLHRGTKRWDYVWMVFFTIAFTALYWVAVDDLKTAGPRAPGVLWWLGLAIHVPSWGLVTWSMSINPFFEKTVRIQTDHGHRVIDTGPYAWVRHPGYVGFSGWVISTSLLLGSPASLVPGGLAIATLVVRTALEDRTLRAELPGYEDYAARVRYRLLPGVW